MAFLAVTLMMFFLAEIRLSLQEMYHLISSTTLEQKVQNCDALK